MAESESGTQVQQPTEAANTYKKKQLLKELGVAVLSLILYVVDIVMVLAVAVLYYKQGDMWWFGLTLSFFFAPSLAMVVAVISEALKEKSIPMAIIGIIFVIIQMVPIAAYISSIYESVKLLKQNYIMSDAAKQFQENISMSATLRLCEGFLEDAPHLVLQMYIMLKSDQTMDTPLEIVRWLSTVVALVSLAWALVAFYRMDRLDESKKDISNCGFILLLLAWAFLGAARLLSLAVFSLFSQYGVFILAAIHYALITTCILFKKRPECSDNEEIWASFLYGFINIFCYLDRLGRNTRYRFTIYHTLLFLENFGMLCAWYFTKDEHIWFHDLVFSIIVGGFFIGIFFFVLYYWKFHPKNDKW